MQIVLARHGQPKLPPFGWISPRQMRDWIDCYNRAEILVADIPLDPRAISAAAGIVASSTAPRCIQSIHSLGCTAPFIAEPMFCEAGLPYLTWSVPKLPVFVWALVFRLAWLCGFSANAESRAEASLRASAAANRLIALAQDHGSVFLMGHGVMTVLIAKHLRAMGWVGSNRPSNRHWEYSIYHSPA